MMKRCFLISKEKPRLFVPQEVICIHSFHVSNGALERTVPFNNPCMLCGLDWAFLAGDLLEGFSHQVFKNFQDGGWNS